MGERDDDALVADRGAVASKEGGTAVTEDRDTKVRRLRMRSMRRGIREMDLILIAFSDLALAGMSEPDLALYDALLSENDHDLYLWIAGQSPAPERYIALVERISAIATGLTRPA